MTDLTQGSLLRHVWTMALPTMIGMFVQSLYLLVDLYFVADLGPAAIAGVSAATNLTLLIMALTQMLSVGCVALISRYTGAKEHEKANTVFQQTMLMGVSLAVLTLGFGYALSDNYMQQMTADPEVQQQAQQFLYAYIPSLALMFVSTAIAAALRAVGVVKPAMMVQLITVLINLILAPVLIAGWGTGYAFGVYGAGLASSLAVVVGVALLWIYFLKSDHSVLQMPKQWGFNFLVWRRIMVIGIPAGGEFALMFVFTAFVYWVIRDFGTSTQAAFGIGNRILQAMMMPAMALSFAIPAIVGQNYGAGQAERVRQCFNIGLKQMALVMLPLFLLTQWLAYPLMQAFTDDLRVVAEGELFLHIISLNFIPIVLVFSCSGVFQGLGNTWPSLASSAVRIFVFIIPVLWLSSRNDFSPEMVWYGSAISLLVQGLISLGLLRWQLRTKLTTKLTTG